MKRIISSIKKYISFNEGNREMKMLLGARVPNLAEMTRLNTPPATGLLYNYKDTATITGGEETYTEEAPREAQVALCW